MEAHCVNMELKYQNQALKDGQHGQILNETSNKAKINKEIEVKTVENAVLKDQIQERFLLNVALKTKLNSNDMVHNYYLEEAKKKTQERDRKSTTSVMPSAKSQNTTKSCKSKLGACSTSRVLPTSMSSCQRTTVMPKADSL
ncbi:hypothetical protein Tco_0573761 [Tanacetum coccineum]